MRKKKKKKNPIPQKREREKGGAFHNRRGKKGINEKKTYWKKTGKNKIDLK